MKHQNATYVVLLRSTFKNYVASAPGHFLCVRILRVLLAWYAGHKFCQAII